MRPQSNNAERTPLLNHGMQSFSASDDDHGKNDHNMSPVNRLNRSGLNFLRLIAIVVATSAAVLVIGVCLLIDGQLLVITKNGKSEKTTLDEQSVTLTDNHSNGKSSDPHNVSDSLFDSHMINNIFTPVSIFDEAIAFGFWKFEQIETLERQLKIKGVVTPPNTPAFYHQLFLSTGTKAKKIANHAQVTEHASRHLKEVFNLSSIEYINDLFDLFHYNNCYINERHDSLYPKKCCDSSYKYRSVDGTCNNLHHPRWGSALFPFRRLISPDYADGISQPRAGQNGSSLPSARKVSTSLYASKKIDDCNCTLLTMLWGLFIDHDITFTATTKGADGSGIACCDSYLHNDTELLHPECFPIDIPTDDEFFRQRNLTCMEFVRSSPAALSHPGPRQQLNQITSYLDGSAVYGSSEEDHFQLRRFTKGKMKISLIHDTPMLPKNEDPLSSCGQPEIGQFCFYAGDSRANEQVFLTSMHTILLREHNRVAEILSKLNPHWSDEVIFQEARRIVAAEMQHITYNEYLPKVLGKRTTKEYNLSLQKEGYYDGYDPNLDATSSNVFATSAFRFGHSQVKGILNLVGKMDKILSKKLLHHTFLNPETLYEEGLDVHTRGMITQRASQVGYVTEELRNHLFESPNSSYGLDLSALTIQRGRDHGLPSYVQWRKYCNLSEISDWNDLEGIMLDEKLATLKMLYQSPKDIDLTPGALAEHHLPRALVGPTHACLIAEQFARLKKADRFWYENGHQPGSFMPGQLQEIRKVTLSRLLCDNSDDLHRIQIKALEPMSKSNFIANCNDNSSAIPSLNLSLWKERVHK